MNDSIKWYPVVKVSKFSPDQVRWATEKLGYEPAGSYMLCSMTPEDEAYSEGNLLTTVGLGRITGLLLGTSSSVCSSSTGFLAVGDSSTAALVADTDLNASTNKYYRTLDSLTAVAGLISMQATYSSTLGNFAWNEWALGCVASGSVTSATTKAGTGTSAIILNHAVPGGGLGTKVNGAQWVFQTTITLS